MIDTIFSVSATTSKGSRLKSIPACINSKKYSNSGKSIKINRVFRDAAGDIEKFDTNQYVKENGETHQNRLKPEHLDTFDFAFKHFRGKRSMQCMAYLRMKAKAKPFISGVISKTASLTKEYAVKDIIDAYVQALKRRLIFVAIYGGGSEQSHPPLIRVKRMRLSQVIS